MLAGKYLHMKCNSYLMDYFTKKTPQNLYKWVIYTQSWAEALYLFSWVLLFFIIQKFLKV